MVLAVCAFLSTAYSLRLLETLPLVLVFYGVWVMALAGVLGRGAAGTFSWGALTTTVGIVWFLGASGLLMGYLLPLLLLVLGILVVAAGLRTWRR